MYVLLVFSYLSVTFCHIVQFPILTCYRTASGGGQRHENEGSRGGATFSSPILNRPEPSSRLPPSFHDWGASESWGGRRGHANPLVLRIEVESSSVISLNAICNICLKLHVHQNHQRALIFLIFVGDVLHIATVHLWRTRSSTFAPLLSKTNT